MPSLFGLELVADTYGYEHTARFGDGNFVHLTMGESYVTLQAQNEEMGALEVQAPLRDHGPPGARQEDELLFVELTLAAKLEHFGAVGTWVLKSLGYSGPVVTA